MDRNLIAIEQAILEDHMGSQKLKQKFGLTRYRGEKYIKLVKEGKHLINELEVDKLTHEDVKVVFSKELTNRFCQTCYGPIYKKFQTEINKKTGEVLSRICVWDRRYTCCGDCESKRWQAINNTSEIYIKDKN